MKTRREILFLLPATGAGLWSTTAQAQAMVDEKDAQATALGYVADAAKADKAKFKTYAAGQVCSGCQLFQGAGNAASGPCALFPGKQVSGKGWCSAYAKKA